MPFFPPLGRISTPLDDSSPPAGARVTAVRVHPSEERFSEVFGVFLLKKKTTRMKTKCPVPLVPTTAGKSKQFSLTEVFVDPPHTLYLGSVLAGVFKVSVSAGVSPLLPHQALPEGTADPGRSLRSPAEPQLWRLSASPHCPGAFTSVPRARLAVAQESEKGMRPPKLSPATGTAPLHVARVFSSESAGLVSQRRIPFGCPDG